MFNLAKVKCGQYFNVAGFSSDAPFKFKRRLLELGFTSGQRVCLKRKSCFKKAYLIEIRGYTLSLRRTLAEYILLEKSL